MTHEELIEKLAKDRVNLTTLIGTLIQLSMYTKGKVDDTRLITTEKTYELRDKVDELLILHS